MLNSLRKIKRLIHLTRTVQMGHKELKKSGKTPESAYYAMRELFTMTNGRFNDVYRVLASIKHPPYKEVKANGVLGDLNSRAVTHIVNNIKRDGYCVFDAVLPLSLINEITQYARNTPVKYLEVGHANNAIQYTQQMVKYDRAHVISPRYQFSMGQIVELPALQSLIFDPSLLAIAQEYLGSKPILDLLAFWWSAPFDGKGTSEAAQMYHFDMDRINFLKFFFYLTDVTTNTGPHCYVRGSHHRLPSALLRDGRITDEAVQNNFPAEDIIEICGKKGTIMAVDTRGLHKGKSLTEGERLLFQIEFATSLFGQSYEKVNSDHLLPEYQALLKKLPYTYGQLFE